MVCNGFHKCHTERVKVKDCAECLTDKEQSKPTVKEKGISYTVGNPNMLTVFVYHVDGGMIIGTDENKCDYLMMFPQRGQAYFIELKSNGADWKEAVEQAQNTVELLYPKMTGYVPHLRAVVGRSAPKTNYTEVLKMRKAFVQKYRGASFEVGSRLTDTVS